MDKYDFSRWFCCLNTGEKQIIRETCLGLVLTLFVGVPKEIWDAFWLVVLDGGAARRDAFVEIYLLKIVTIDPGNGEDAYAAVAPDDLAFWVELSIWILTPAALCPDGCSNVVYP